MKSKKELKAAYKQQKPIAGVFQIQNTKSGRVLIEESVNIHSKWNRHRSELRFKSHRNKALQDDWNTIGEENFEFSVLSELTIKEDDHFNINDEIKLLRQMVEEEINLPDEMKY